MNSERLEAVEWKFFRLYTVHRSGSISIVRHVPEFVYAHPHAVRPPFGWTVEINYFRRGVEIGPSWYMIPRRIFRTCRQSFYGWADAVRLRIVAPCNLWSDGEWFPDFPKFR